MGQVALAYDLDEDIKDIGELMLEGELHHHTQLYRVQAHFHWWRLDCRENTSHQDFIPPVNYLNAATTLPANHSIAAYPINHSITATPPVNHSVTATPPVNHLVTATHPVNIQSQQHHQSIILSGQPTLSQSFYQGSPPTHSQSFY